MAQTRPAPSYAPDLVASRLIFGGYVALTGYALWGQHVLAEWSRAHSLPPSLLRPITVLDVVAAGIGLAAQAWITRGTARSARSALVLMALFAGEGLGRFFSSMDNMPPRGDPQAWPSSAVLPVIWASGAFFFGALGYGVLRLFRMLGPMPLATEPAKRLFADRVAGSAFAMGFVALGLWSLGQGLRSGALGHGAPFFAGGTLSVQLFTCAIAVYVSFGVSRSESWASLVLALLGTRNSLSLLHGMPQAALIPYHALWVSTLLYLGLRLLMQTQLSPYPEAAAD